MIRTWPSIWALCMLLALPALAQRAPIQPLPAEHIRKVLASRLEAAELARLQIPFEADEEIRSLARKLTAGSHGDHQKLSALRRYFKHQGFLERYDRDGLRTAIEANRDGEGNCVAYANLFVAMARSVGLRALFLDASTEGDEYAKSGSVLVHYGHVLVGVRMGAEFVAIEFDGRAGTPHRFRVLSDFEALADYYNNLGYARAWTHRERGGLGSLESIRAFRMATHIAPSYARAWNNLGVALGRADEPEQAVRAYHRAIAADASFPAPWANLGQLALKSGDATAARSALLRAVELSPQNPHYRYFLAKAMTGTGDLKSALAELERGRALDESMFQIHMQMAEVYWQLGAEREAMAAAREVVKLVPGHRDANKLLQLIEARQQPRVEGDDS